MPAKSASLRVQMALIVASVPAFPCGAFRATLPPRRRHLHVLGDASHGHGEVRDALSLILRHV